VNLTRRNNAASAVAAANAAATAVQAANLAKAAAVTAVAAAAPSARARGAGSRGATPLTPAQMEAAVAQIAAASARPVTHADLEALDEGYLLAREQAKYARIQRERALAAAAPNRPDLRIRTPSAAAGGEGLSPPPPEPDQLALLMAAYPEFYGPRESEYSSWRRTHVFPELAGRPATKRNNSLSPNALEYAAVYGASGLPASGSRLTRTNSMSRRMLEGNTLQKEKKPSLASPKNMDEAIATMKLLKYLSSTFSPTRFIPYTPEQKVEILKNIKGFIDDGADVNVRMWSPFSLEGPTKRYGIAEYMDISIYEYLLTVLGDDRLLGGVEGSTEVLSIMANKASGGGSRKKTRRCWNRKAGKSRKGHKLSK